MGVGNFDRLPGPFNCFTNPVVVAGSGLLEKTFVIEGIPVGSITEYNAEVVVPLGVVPSQTISTAKVFGYTSTWFLCQDSDGQCPEDPESQAPGFAFPSPFASVFDGVCDTDANGFYKVCVYACLRTKVVVW